MKYQVKVKSPAEREAMIRAAISASKVTRDFHEFRSTKLQLPLVRVAENVLVYRMENFRTYIEQHEYAIRENKPLDFFAISQENESVQQLQHEILFRLAKQGRADSIVPVIDVLKREKQREWLLITHRGVVVNGNRRLAGMRELFAEDGSAHGDFSHIDCLVLPEDATTSEIVDIEAALQAKPETRLDYDWISDCLLIQRLIELGKNVEQVAHKLNRNRSEIKNSLNALAEADLYLKDWAKAEGQYSRVVDGGEQLFKDLPNLLQGKEPGLQEASRVIAWNLFENSEKLDGRLYAFNPTIGKQAANVLDRVAADLGVSIEGDSNADDESFEVDVDAAAGTTSYQPLIDIFRSPARRDEAIETLIDVCRGVIESERGKKSGQAALKAITTANARLVEADLTRADPGTYGAIEKQLEQITKRVQLLQRTISELNKSLAGKLGSGSSTGE